VIFDELSYHEATIFREMRADSVLAARRHESDRSHETIAWTERQPKLGGHERIALGERRNVRAKGERFAHDERDRERCIAETDESFANRGGIGGTVFASESRQDDVVGDADTRLERVGAEENREPRGGHAPLGGHEIAREGCAWPRREDTRGCGRAFAQTRDEHGGNGTRERGRCGLRRIDDLRCTLAQSLRHDRGGERAFQLDEYVMRRLTCRQQYADGVVGTARRVSLSDASNEDLDGLAQELRERGGNRFGMRKPACKATHARGGVDAFAGERLDRAPRKRGYARVHGFCHARVQCRSLVMRTAVSVTSGS
jgi:hypothetical protein